MEPLRRSDNQGSDVLPKQTPAVPPPSGFRRLAIATVLVLTAARVVSLVFNTTDLYVDEAQYWTWATEPDWGYFSKPPLIAWIIAATTALFGDGTWAVRLAAPLLHGGTALLLMLVGDRLYGGRVGGWAAILWATLPAVALSSTLISTDVPLLFAWSAGLLAAVRLVERDDLAAAAGLGAAIAVGLNAKYAMALLPASLILALLADPGTRGRLRSPRLWGAIGIGLVGLVPNLVWNIRHDFVTLRHTGGNADWGSRMLDLGSVAEFVGAQFGVFGPVAFALLVAAGLGRLRSDRPAADRFLLLLSLPIVVVFVGQSLVADANANWAATAYPAGIVLVAGLMEHRLRLAVWRRVSMVIAGAASAVLVLAPPFAADLRLPVIGRPFERMLGWTDFAGAVGAAAARSGARTVIAVRRADTAGLLYALRDTGLRVAVMPPAGPYPEDHYQMTRPFTAALPGPGLVVAPPGSALPAGLVPSGPALAIPVGRGVAKSLAMEAVPVRW